MRELFDCAHFNRPGGGCQRVVVTGRLDCGLKSGLYSFEFFQRRSRRLRIFVSGKGVCGHLLLLIPEVRSRQQ